MIVVDTSVWVDHLRTGDAALAAQLEAGTVMIHPHVLGELACGNLRDRARVIAALRELTQAHLSPEDEALAFIESNGLMGRGIGYIDVRLLASASNQGALLWTRDRKLAEVAQELGIRFVESGRASDV